MAAQKVIGVIGLGSIGARHAKNLEALGCKVIGYDPQLSAQDNRLPPLVDVVAVSEALVIASPTNHHYHHIFDCSSKPLFVEKPLTHGPTTLFDHNWEAIKMVGYNLRFHSCVIQAQKWLLHNAIGKPLWANFTCAQYNDRPNYLRDGVILNWSHEIDLACYLLGDCRVAASSTRLTDGKDDMTDILLTHDNGCRTTVHLDYLTRPEYRGFVIAGDKGVIEVDLPNRTAKLSPHGDYVSFEVDQGGSYDEDYKTEMQAFLDRIDGKTTLGCTGEEALKVLEICLEVRKQAGL